MPTLSQQLLKEVEAGYSQADICKKHNLTASELRILLTGARADRRMTLTEDVRLMAETGHFSNVDIAAHLGLTESEVRILLKGE
jgi:DNA-directed RNA polymerase specialized sigma24 family protein